MYITDLSCISPQLTYNGEFLKGVKTDHKDVIFKVLEPNYLEIIPKGLLRRMGKAVRMGVGTGLPLVKTHNDIDGILIGTANGGLEDCIKFLNQIVEYDEGVLTPTNFVQSTPNAVAGQLAMMSSNRNYNITYTNGGLSFENALLDALLLIEEGEANKLLVGGLEEISDYNYNIDSLSGMFKEKIVSDDEMLDSTTEGTVCGEGASMFIVTNKADNYYAKIVDVCQLTLPEISDIKNELDGFLKRNNLSFNDIDCLMLGENGDVRHAVWYKNMSEVLFPKSNVLSFKNLVGDFRTGSSFATWIAAHVLNGNKDILPYITRRTVTPKAPNHILIYNHFDEARHGFILLSK